MRNLRNLLSSKLFVLSLFVIAFAAATPPVRELIFGQVRRSDGLHIGGTTTDVWADGNLYSSSPDGGASLKAKSRATCTLDGASPAVCTATVPAGSVCVCAPVGATAAIAAFNCAVSLSGTTLTVTAADAGNSVVNIICL